LHKTVFNRELTPVLRIVLKIEMAEIIFTVTVVL
jgi:hypothetical protein